MSILTTRSFTAIKLLTYAACALVASCHLPGIDGNGKVTTQSRPVPTFESVEAGGMFEIQWSAGPANVVLTTDQNLFDHIRTTVSGKTLRIDWDTQLKPTDGIKIKLSSPALTGAELNGAVRFSAAKLSGASFAIEGNGATRITLDGVVSSLSASLNGASRLQAEQLQTQECEMSISGAGRADVTVSESLKVAISGAGKVTYAGNPKTLKKNVSGAGSIKRRD